MVSECKQIPVDGRQDGRGPEAQEEVEEEEAPLLCARGVHEGLVATGRIIKVRKIKRRFAHHNDTSLDKERCS